MPNLASSLPVITDGETTYAFQLRRGIRYSNGTLVKASDFRRAFERPFRAGLVGRPDFPPLVGSGACKRRPRSCDLSRGVRTDDATGTIVFHLRRPDREFLSESDRVFPIPPRHAEPGYGDASGRLDRAVHDRELRAGTGAHARPQPLLPRVGESRRPDGFPDEIVVQTDRPRKRRHGRRARAGRRRLLALHSTEDVKALEESRGALPVAGPPASSAGDRLPLPQYDTPPFDDVRVRQAVNSPSTAPPFQGRRGPGSPSRPASPARPAPWPSSATALHCRPGPDGRMEGA